MDAAKSTHVGAFQNIANSAITLAGLSATLYILGFEYHKGFFSVLGVDVASLSLAADFYFRGGFIPVFYLILALVASFVLAWILVATARVLRGRYRVQATGRVLLAVASVVAELMLLAGAHLLSSCILVVVLSLAALATAGWLVVSCLRGGLMAGLQPSTDSAAYATAVGVLIGAVVITVMAYYAHVLGEAAATEALGGRGGILTRATMLQDAVIYATEPLGLPGESLCVGCSQNAVFEYEGYVLVIHNDALYYLLRPGPGGVPAAALFIVPDSGVALLEVRGHWQPRAVAAPAPTAQPPSCLQAPTPD